MYRVLGLLIAVLLGMALGHLTTTDWFRSRFDKKAYYEEKNESIKMNGNKYKIK